MNATVAALLFLIMGLAVGFLLGWSVRGNRGSAADNGQLAALLAATLKAENSEQQHLAQAEISQRVHETLQPLAGAVGALSQQVHQLDVERAETYAHLTSQVQAMSRTSTQLSDRTHKLTTALRAPHVRGRWGEMQLERVVELAGMVPHCDFDVQVSEGKLRPDMVIRLSNGRNIIVDAKAPFVAYLDALETEDPEEHAGHLRRHANHLRTHVTQLGNKQYQHSFSPTPDFVILFVPADPFLDAAMREDPELLEYAFSKNVVLATPSTLIALLRTIALGWQQESLNDQAAEIQRLGSELYRRLASVSEHLDRLRGSLEKSVDAFNSTVASMESRVFVTARKIDDLEVLPSSTTPVRDVGYINSTPRHLRHIE